MENNEKDATLLKTVGGWVLIGGIIGLFLYSSQGKRKHVANKVSTQSNSDAQSVSGVPKKKVERAQKQRAKPKPSTSPVANNEAFSSSYNRDIELASSKDVDREFARQLTNAKTGKNFTATKSEEKKQKSVKQSKAQEMPDALRGKLSAPSSTTGDADDDLSPAVSPVVGAIDARDVSDMLEKPAAGPPPVLRLTATDSVKPKEKKSQVPEVKLSKKQRQNQKKNEEKKVANAEAEIERKKKMESQRRLAREAEGRPAKDGSAFMAAQRENAWTSKTTNGESNFLPVQPLDTFDEKPVAESKSAETPKPVASSNSDSWVEPLLSEEEQLKMIEQEETSWNEVTSKKKKGKRNKEQAADNSTNSTNSTSPENGPSSNGASKAKAPVNGDSKKPKIVSSSSSFAALTPDETTDDNDAEEEWDV